MGGVGCVFGGVAWYYLFFYLIHLSGFDANTPVREYSGDIALALLFLAFLLLTVLLYVFCVIASLVFWGFTFKAGSISREELINLCFKGVYPDRWYRSFLSGE